MGVYLITGTAYGLSAEIAVQLAGAGHAITLAAIEHRALPGVRSVFCDVTDEGQVASLMSGFEVVEGRLDGMLHHSAANDETSHITTARLFHAAAALLRAGTGTAIAMGTQEAPALRRNLSRQLGPNIRLNWLPTTEAHMAAGLLTAG